MPLVFSSATALRSLLSAMRTLRLASLSPKARAAAAFTSLPSRTSSRRNRMNWFTFAFSRAKASRSAGGTIVSHSATVLSSRSSEPSRLSP